MISRVTSFAVLAVILAVQPLYGNSRDTPPVPGEEMAGTQALPSTVCPVDRRDGPLYADGRSYYGIPAQRIVEGFLASPREGDAWRNVSVSSVRVLTDDADYDACLRLTAIITGGIRNSPPPPTWVYFTAGGFYFVSQWKPAQALSSYTTSYGHVMVYDSAFNLLGAFAF